MEGKIPSKKSLIDLIRSKLDSLIIELVGGEKFPSV